MLRARPLSAAEQSEVAEWLSADEQQLFWRQQTADQRHGLDTARKLAAQRPDDVELIRAGLLHDVGKAESALGPIGRSLATLAGVLHLPLPERYRSYLQHGPIGAAMLRSLAADPLVVDFAEHHPGAAPEGHDAERWRLLLAADDD